MAVYFLAKSQTYVEQTEIRIYRRREVVCKHLKDDYRAKRNADLAIYREVARELAAEEIEISQSAYQADKAIIRSVDLWLTAGTNEKRKEVYNRVSSSTRTGITCLQKNGIRNWSDLGFGAAPTEDGTEDTPPPERLKLADLQAGKQVVEIAAQLMGALQAMVNENELLKREYAAIVAENAEIKERMSQSEEYNVYADGENAALEERLRRLEESVRTIHAATLEEIAEKNPKFPQLLTIAEEMKTDVGIRQARIRELEKRLPQTFGWASDSGKIEYKPTFLKALADLTKEEQTQVVLQLETLALQGPEYASLHTRKSKMRLPHSPLGCFVSRGANDLRFTWIKNGIVVLHWLYRKGDTRVKQTEK